MQRIRGWLFSLRGWLIRKLAGRYGVVGNVTCYGAVSFGDRGGWAFDSEFKQPVTVDNPTGRKDAAQ